MADLYFTTGSLALAKSKYESLLKMNPSDAHAQRRLQEINRRRKF
jgi:hypothetical protein